MPPKKCGRCEKTVYPTEELKCLDKVWHKGCFKCQVCNMTLNMKNYKGYDKLPYCNAHYPQTKHTAVADTPEQRRIAENTKIQSNIHYHSDFERERGSYRQVADSLDMKLHLKNTQNLSLVQYKQQFEETKSRYIQIADFPELERVKKNQQNISMIKYHEEFEKQKGKKMTIADDPEMQRVRQNMEVISNVAYYGDRDKKYQMDMMRPAEQLHVGPPRHHSGGYQQEEPHTGGTPYSSRNSAGARQVYDSSVGKARGPVQIKAGQSVDDFIMEDRVERFSSSGDDGSGMMEQPSQRKVGSISDYDPMNENYGSITGQGGQGQRRSTGQQPQHQPAPQQYRPPEPVPAPAPQDPRDRYAAKGRRPGRGKTCATAMYDYNAADTDEVSFNEGDIIIDCQDIDAGWMEGTVERTGLRGMLPSNYVEKF